MKLLLILLWSVCVYAHSVLPLVEDVDTVVSFIDQKWSNNLVSIHAQKPDGVNDLTLVYQLEDYERTYGRNFIENAIKDVLDGFRDIVINGNDVLPPLDPLEIQHLGPFRYGTTGARVTANIRDINLDGLRWYTADDVTFNIIRLTFGLQATIPRLTLTGKYDVAARVALFITHNAGGNFRIFLNRLEFGVNARLGTNIFGGGHLVLRELDIKINIHDTNIRIEGMVGSNLINNIINSVIQNVSQGVIQDQLDNLNNTLSVELFDIINEVLKSFTLADILG